MKSFTFYRKLLVSLVLILTVNTTVFCQQAVEQYNTNGLSKTIFNSTNGKITIYLPMNALKERSSGTITIEPFGDSDRKKASNLELLRSYKITLGGQTFPVSSSIVQLKAESTTEGMLQLLNGRGKVISSSRFTATSVDSRLSTITQIPSYIVANEQAMIASKCDGNLSNNAVRINNSEAVLLAESESDLFFEVPSNVNGEYQLIFENGTERIETNVHVIKLVLNAEKLDLHRGESTNLSIEVSGLSGLNEALPLTITNLSPSNITLEGGNFQQLAIDPLQDAPSGTYRTSRSITATQNGGFSISVNVIPPQFTYSVVQNEVLCNCRIEDRTYLINATQCESLGGNCSEDVPEEPETGDTADDVENDPNFACEFPIEISSLNDQITLEVNDRNENDCVAVSFSYRALEDEQWQFIGSDNTAKDGLTFVWNPPLGNDGVVEVQASVVNKSNKISHYSQFVNLSITPESINDASLNVSYSVSEGDIKRALDKARGTGDRIKEEEEKLAELIRKYWEAIDKKKEDQDAYNELVAIDKILDKIPDAYKDALKKIVDSLASLRKQLPAKIDKAALQKAVDDAQQRLDDCKKRLAELKKEQADLEAERDRLKHELDDTLEEIHKLHTDNGWTGDYGYHADGRPWYGYIGDESANTDIDSEQYRLRKKLRELRKPYLKALRRLEQLPNEIDEAQKECDDLNDALEKAKEAAEKGDQYLAAEVEAEDICRQIESLLRPIYQWCLKNPGDCSFLEKLKKLMEDCPKDSAALDAFWDEFDAIVKAKKEKEKEFSDTVDDDQDTISEIENDIKNAEDKINGLRDQQEREYAEAERKRKKRAQELEAERQRKRDAEARKKEEERRTAPVPEPYLDEPVDPNNDQLKFQAQRLFKELYRDYLIANGPCDCKTKAIAFANNTNSIVTDIIGRIGVGVAFAPLEAFPGVSLGGRLGLGAVKALASALFGGQSFSEELTKNLFEVIGGEIFPKLVGNKFTGDRINGLAGKGLEDILEAEGVRAISWEGKSKICGEEVSGKTTMLINPNTGWVTILIKIDNCPLVVIKYKINEDGVALSKPKPKVEVVKE